MSDQTNVPALVEDRNPFRAPVTRQANAVAAVEEQRAIAEVQAAMVVAKRFPRDQHQAVANILEACKRPKLAEAALYSYSRGGTEITGPTIRLAEAIAQTWGNMAFGIRELEQAHGESTVEAFAWDLETNTRQSKTFHVPHIRFANVWDKATNTKKPVKTVLVDPRDIYEAVANNGARRLRACILGVIPGDVIEAALAQCDDTMKANAIATPEAISKLVEAFKEFGVTPRQIAVRAQCDIVAIRAPQIVSFKKIWRSLKDGMSKPEDWFGPSELVGDKTAEAKKDDSKDEPKSEAKAEAATGGPELAKKAEPTAEPQRLKRNNAEMAAEVPLDLVPACRASGVTPAEFMAQRKRAAEALNEAQRKEGEAAARKRIANERDDDLVPFDNTSPKNPIPDPGQADTGHQLGEQPAITTRRRSTARFRIGDE